MAEDIRQVADFNRIVLRDWGKLVIMRAENTSLIVEADEEFLDNITSDVANGTLTLRIGRKWLDVVKNTFQTGMDRQKVTYYLNLPVLDSLEVLGAAKVEADGLSGDEFSLVFGGAGDVEMLNCEFDDIDIEMPGAGKLKVTGKVGKQHVVLSGAGSYQARELESENAVVELRGVGKATVFANVRLKAIVRGVGSVEYFGNPEVEKVISGLGQVTRGSKT
jgi:hypothetical protein